MKTKYSLYSWQQLSEGKYMNLIIRLEMVKQLLKHPLIDLNQQDSHGINAFWMAAYQNECDILKILAMSSIDILATNENGSNALHIAVKRANIEAVMVLIEIKFPLNLAKKNGVAALGIAVHIGSIEI